MRKAKLIESYLITDASVHDSLPIMELLEEQDSGQPLYADSAYRSQEIEEVLDFLGIVSQVHEKGVKNSPLTELQELANKGKSKFRVRIEHIFGFIENSMNGSRIKSIGIQRAKGTIGLMNLTYNMFRVIQLSAIKGISVSI